MPSMDERATRRGEILVVEDTPASLQLLGDLLRGAGYLVRQAPEGRMALQSARAEPPDLVLLDVRMPGIDGYEVCRRLKEDPRTRDVPVIFLSALRDAEDKVRGFAAGAVDYVAKPYQAEEVLARVRTHVELHRLRVSLEARVRERTLRIEASERELRVSEERLRQLAEFLQSVREDERTRIARELHDELGQSLTALRLDLGWLRARCADLGPEVPERIGQALKLVEQSVVVLRRICDDLRPSMLDALGLAAAVEHHAGQFSERTGVPCRLALDREEFEVNDRVATAAFRIVQEALTNVARHAGARNAWVSIVQETAVLAVEVRDDGVGFVEEAGRRTHGLLGMRERAKALGGDVTIESKPGHGTRIRARLPLEKPA